MLKQLLILAALFPLSSAAQQPAQKVLGDGLKTLFSNSTIAGTGSDGFSFMQRLKADGTMSGEATPAGGGSKRTDSGTWFVKGDQVCMQYRRWRDGREFCRGVESLGGETYRYSDGTTITLSTAR